MSEAYTPTALSGGSALLGVRMPAWRTIFFASALSLSVTTIVATPVNSWSENGNPPSTVAATSPCG